MSDAYLITYKDDTWRGEMGRYTFNNMPGFTAWPDSQNEQTSTT